MLCKNQITKVDTNLHKRTVPHGRFDLYLPIKQKTSNCTGEVFYWKINPCIDKSKKYLENNDKYELFMPTILVCYDIQYKNGDYVILYYLFTWKCQLAKMFEIETQIVFGNVTCVVMIWV